MERHSTGADLLGVLLGFLFMLTGGFILDMVLPSGVWGSLPRWAKGAGFIAAFVIGYMLWVWLAALFLALSGKQGVSNDESTPPKLPEDLEGTYSRLPTEKLEVLLKQEAELIPGAGDFLRREVARRHEQGEESS